MAYKANMTRETQVMILASEGFTDKQIASYLGISADTVSTYWRRILARFGASSRTEVIAKMVQQQAAEAIAKATAENNELKAEIEQRVIAEQLLGATSERLNLLMEGIDAGVLFFTEELLVLYANTAFAELFGIDNNLESLVGTSNAVIEAMIRGVLVAPKQLEANTARLIAGGEPSGSERIELSNGNILDRSYKKISVDETSFGHLFIFRDVTLREREKSRLEYHSAFSTLVANVAPSMIAAKSENTNSVLDFALGEIGKFAEVDRAYVFKFAHGPKTLSCTNEWCARGISGEKENLQQLPMSMFKWFTDQIENRKTIVLNDVTLLGDEAASERESFKDQGIQSLLVVPLTGSEGQALGFFGFDSVRTKREWDELFIDLLKPFSAMVSTLLEQFEAFVKVQP